MGDGEHLAQVTSSRLCTGALGALYESTCKRLQPVWPGPTGPTLLWSDSHLASPGKPKGGQVPPWQRTTHPPPSSSYLAGNQPPSFRINYWTGPFSLKVHTSYTALIPSSSFFSFCFDCCDGQHFLSCSSESSPQGKGEEIILFLLSTKCISEANGGIHCLVCHCSLLINLHIHVTWGWEGLRYKTLSPSPPPASCCTLLRACRL